MYITIIIKWILSEPRCGVDNNVPYVLYEGSLLFIVPEVKGE
jgi:hypothetical protein